MGQAKHKAERSRLGEIGEIIGALFGGGKADEGDVGELGVGCGGSVFFSVSFVGLEYPEQDRVFGEP